MAPQVTPLYERHRALGARFIEFHGWLMPVQYRGIVSEHIAVRTRAGLFDLGHMGQIVVRGADAVPFLQYLTPNDVARLRPGTAQYSMFLYPSGGVVDDIIVYYLAEGNEYFVVVNAANRTKDLEWLREHRARHQAWNVEIEDVSDRTGMLALQGPLAESILQRLTTQDLAALAPFAIARAEVAGTATLIARTGYTGEDGFELYCPIERTVELWDTLLETGEAEGLVPVGLGARDTLRIEAALPLYGNELGPDITPLEAGLEWVVRWDKGDFVGRESLARQREEGPPRRLVGFVLTERGGIPRTGYPVQVEGQIIGAVTSGTSSPTLEKTIGMALIDRRFAGIGRPLAVVIRERPVAAVQVKLPFYRRARRRSVTDSASEGGNGHG
ncbi:MAG: glycine cleavage system aminomethyltransferase GcvT [Thermomicrobium sp.]|nr:glycine cleavage system aminomethyltransferase GcvT [Thermomicrobium sp.]MDW8059028.1 glycine cleavage system aminomethyltransferase GcvT [Thermomicrobium sp.]